MIRSIVIKSLALLLLVAFINFVYTHTLFEKDLEKHSPEILDFRRSIPDAEVYYFGESSNTTFAEQDSANNSISDFCSKFFPGLKFKNINKEATHAGVYRYWLNEFDKAQHYPKALIVTMNLRSFGASWIHSDLENSLKQSLVLSEPGPAIVNRFLLSLQAFDTKSKLENETQILKCWKEDQLFLPKSFPNQTVRQWDDAMAAGGHLLPNGKWDGAKIELACHYIKAYAFRLNESNQRVRDFDAIKDWCVKGKVPLYLNLMSENVAFADSLVGKELVFLMRQNRDFLLNRYNDNSCRVVDNLELVESNDFIDQNWTTEHYVARGRMRLAKNLASELKNRFEKEYVKAY